MLCSITYNTCCNSTADNRHCITNDVTILTATEHRTINFCSARYINRGSAHIGPCIEEHTLVALTSTEHVANDRIKINLFLSTWYANGTTRYVDGTSACAFFLKCCCRLAIATQRIRTHIGILISAINTGQDVSASDIHLGITCYRTCCTMPFSSSKRNNTTATAKHVTIICMAVCGYWCTTLRRLCKFSIIIIFIISRIQMCRILVIRLTCGYLVIRPCCTCGKGVVCSHRSSGWVNESSILVWCSFIQSFTNLSSCDGYMSISL